MVGLAHQNIMCLSNKSWPLSCLSYNIHSMVDSLISCFVTTPNVESSHRFIRWHNDNHSCTILNVYGSCLDTPVRAGYGGNIRNHDAFIYQVFLVIFMTLLTFCMLSFTLSTRV